MRNGGFRAFRLLSQGLGELRGGKTKSLHQPERLALLDRSGLFVIAEQDQPRTGHPADLEDADRLARPKLSRLAPASAMQPTSRACCQGSKCPLRAKRGRRQPTPTGAVRADPVGRVLNAKKYRSDRGHAQSDGQHLH
jgi:hypothetical protein